MSLKCLMVPQNKEVEEIEVEGGGGGGHQTPLEGVPNAKGGIS